MFALALIVLGATSAMTVAGAQQPIVGPWIYEPYTFTTLAGLTQDSDGDGIPDGAFADGTGSDARFNGPSGVAVDSDGNLYVAEFYNYTIRKITSAGIVTTLAGLAGNSGSADGTGSDARFSYPYGVAVDSAGNVYVSDLNNTIRKVTPTGVVTTLAGLAQVANGNPVAGYADGVGSDARFNSPFGIAVDSAGTIYVADTWNNAIRKVSAAGVVSTMVGSADFGNPRAVAVDNAGNSYVAGGNGTIWKVTAAGLVTTLAGGVYGSVDGSGSAAGVLLPQGVAVDSAGNVYVAESETDLSRISAIRKVTPAGAVTTLAGLAGSYGSTDGTGSQAQFYRPIGIAVDGRGYVYVADILNHTLRKGNPAPRILNSGPGFGFIGGQFGFNLTGPAGRLVVVEASADLVNWLPLWTNTFTFQVPLDFIDAQGGVSGHRFYRERVP